MPRQRGLHIAAAVEGGGGWVAYCVCVGVRGALAFVTGLVSIVGLGVAIV